jgi:hypothetical protein
MHFEVTPMSFASEHGCLHTEENYCQVADTWEFKPLTRKKLNGETNHAE